MTSPHVLYRAFAGESAPVQSVRVRAHKQGVSEMSSIEIIRTARELLADPKHWHQGDRTNVDGSAMCAVHAIRYSARVLLDIRDEDVTKAAWELVRAHVPTGEGLSVYNDDPSTTHQDILNLFDKTICDLGGAL